MPRQQTTSQTIRGMAGCHGCRWYLGISNGSELDAAKAAARVHTHDTGHHVYLHLTKMQIIEWIP